MSSQSITPHAEKVAPDPRGQLWTDADMDFLRTNYGPRGDKHCALHLKRSRLAVRLKALRMGLAKPRLTMAAIVSRWVSPEPCA